MTISHLPKPKETIGDEDTFSPLCIFVGGSGVVSNIITSTGNNFFIGKARHSLNKTSYKMITSAMKVSVTFA